MTSAARKLRTDLDAGRSLGDLVGRIYAADEVVDDTTALGADGPRIKTHTSYGFATQVVILDGDGRVERVVAAHDVGRVVNPVLCRGQIEGSIHMGLGYALTEELTCEDGWPVTSSLREIGVLRARHPLRCIHCEEPACIEACISGSMAKDEVGGRVANHLVQCVGCWMCVMNCPYSAAVPCLKKSIKCDYCLFGEAPSCVRAGPTKALVFCEPQEYERRLQVRQKWRERG